MSDSQNEESKGFFYKFDLTNPIEGVIQEYENERESFWACKGPGYQIEYDRAERFAKFVLEGVENLTSAQKIDEDLANLQYEATKENSIWEKFGDKLRSIKSGKEFSKEEIEELGKIFKEFPEKPENENSPLHLVWERFCIDLAWEAINKMDEGADRIFRLYKLMLSSPLPRTTINYLLRLSRCYIWGFDPECIILCRSVLDTAFRKKILGETSKNYHQEDLFEYDLKNGINAAIEKHLIDEKTGKLAHSVRIRGNKAIHNQPDATKDVWGTICNTISVLEVLFSK